jgi:hypothetical protein
MKTIEEEVWFRMRRDGNDLDGVINELEEERKELKVRKSCGTIAALVFAIRREDTRWIRD